MPRPRRPRTVLLSSLLAVVAALVLALAYLQPRAPGRQLSVTELQSRLDGRGVASAVLRDEDSRLIGRLADGERFWVAVPKDGVSTAPLLTQLSEAGASVRVDSQESKVVVRLVATVLLPLVLLANLFALLFVGGRGGGDGIGQLAAFGSIGGGRVSNRLTGRLSRRGRTGPAFTFASVAGADEAVVELAEVVDYLRNPTKYAVLDAAPPKGVLLFGPPGTGKTLLARATAGEAGVPFFSVAGAEFVESLVGVGAARVRDLFARVRAAAPAIVFIDELDAAGRRRGGGDGGGSDEREQTLNQLLVEMDGFDVATGVVVIAATNRPDILDPALLRPGRFDRHITVEEPDVTGRTAILAIHAAGRPVAPEVDLADIARRTPGFTGADLASVVNEAALLSIRAGLSEIGRAQVREAVERVRSGPQRRGRVLSEDHRHRVAVHEAAHAVVVALTETPASVDRVSILGRAGGLVSSRRGESDEVVLATSSQLHAQLAQAVAGTAGEQLLLGEVSTGSERDLERATALALDLVARFGMSDLGPARRLAGVAGGYLGEAPRLADISPATHERVDAEVERLLAEAVEDATAILTAHQGMLAGLVDALVASEHVEGSRLQALLSPAARPSVGHKMLN